MNENIKTATRHFPGGTTTATILPVGGVYRTTVITRFHSGNYLTEANTVSLTSVEAERAARVYVGDASWV